MNHIDLIRCRRPWIEQVPWKGGFTRRGSTTNADLLARIVEAYHAASHAERVRGTEHGGLWPALRGSSLNELVALLEGGDLQQLGGYLDDLPRRSAGQGYFQGSQLYQLISSDPSTERRTLLWTVDAICGVAEALGILPVMCPEQSEWDRVIVSDQEDLVQSIEHCIGMSMHVPQICAGLFGIAVGERVVHARSAAAAYVAWRVKEWFQQHQGAPLAGLRVAEIGAGVGLVPLFLHACGFRDVSLFDLPEINAVQAFFLGHALPDCPLILFNEPDAGQPAARILPYFSFVEREQDRFDLVINQDSFPEIGAATVLRYLNRIANAAAYFLSVNQETQAPADAKTRQLRVCDIVAHVPALKRSYRYPFWPRFGYVEEMYTAHH